MASGFRGSVIESVRRLYAAGAASALSEAQLLERFAARGDAAAFEAILLRHGPMVLGVCRRVLDDPHDVDDAFQATFLVLIRKAGSIRDRDVLGTWLYGVARRVAVRARVNARRRGARERAGAQGVEVADPRGDRHDADELRAMIESELERLPERYRTPIVLCDLEGQTHEQAADQLRCPVGTVKSRLSRGREQLRSRLERRGVSPSTSSRAPALLAGTATATAVPAELVNPTIRAAARFAATPADPAGSCSAGATALAKGVLSSMALSKVKLSAAVLLLLAMTVAGARAFVGRAPAGPAGTEDSSSPQGSVRATTPVALADRPAQRAKAVAAPADASPTEPGVRRFVLENGLTVMLRPIRGSRTVSLVVLYSVGHDHDPDGQSGLAHMVEHVYVTAAAGGEKARTSEEFARRYHADGANAQTGDRYTVVAAVFPEKELDEELKDAAARMGDLRITAADLEREAPRLLQEIGNMFGAFPPLAAQNNARELVRPTPRGGRHGGQPERIRSLTPETLSARWRRYYKPRNAIVVLAGAIDPAAARKAVASHFAGLPAGEPVPAPGDPGRPQYGTLRQLAVKSSIPDAEPMACLAYSAPQPGSGLYAPFLVLISRLWAGAGKLGGGPTSFPVYFTPLDDGAIVAVSAPAKRGESAEAANARLESFVAETMERRLRDGEIASTRQQLGFLLGLGEMPDEDLAQNPYGVAFSLGRRAQLGLDTAQLDRALGAVTDEDLRRAAEEVFAPKRHAGVFVAVQ